MQEFNMETNVIEETPIHSKVGIASFLVALLGALIFCIGFAIAFSIGFSSASSGGMIDQSSSAFRLATISMCGSVFVNVIAMGLGIGSLFQPKSKRTFGIIGLVLSVVVLCVFGGFAIIGLAQ